MNYLQILNKDFFKKIIYKIYIIYKKILGYDHHKWCLGIVDKNNFLNNVFFYPPQK